MAFIQRLRPHWASPNHPIFDLESRRRMDNRSLMAMRWGCLPAIFGVTGLTVLILSIAIAASNGFWSPDEGMMAVLWAVEVAIWLIQIGAGAMVNILVIAQAAPAISGEVELQSWQLLRTTTLPLREIILSKFAAVFDQLRQPFIGLIILRSISLVTAFFLIAFMLRQTFYYMSPGEWARFWTDGLWLPIGMLILLGLLFYSIQPIVQFAFNSVLAMLASAFNGSRSRAMAAGLVGRLVGWVSSIVLNIGAIFFLAFIIFGNWAQPRYAPIGFFQAFDTPSELAVAWVGSSVGIIYILILFAMQMVFIFVGMRVAERRASRIGA